MSSLPSLFAGGLATGLLAGTGSCAAVQGGLLVGIARGPAGSDPPLDEADGTQASTRRDAGSGGRVVALFLAGRAASHVLMGLLLGALGSAVQPPPAVRAALLVVAGIVVIAFAVGLFRRGAAVATCDCTPIGARTPGVRTPGVRTPRARAAGGRPWWAAGGRTWRAAALGAATILVPCGVTLSVEVLAVATGSALAGAITMAGFVAGTAPGLALLGLVVRRVGRGRLARVAALAALAAGVWTGVAGLRLGGWLPAPAPEAASGAQAAAVMAIPRADGSQSVDVWVTERGYRPGILTARAGVPTRLIVHTANTTGCLRTLTISGRDHALPATGATPIALGAHPPSTLHFACGMGMYQGFVEFRTAP